MAADPGTITRTVHVVNRPWPEWWVWDVRIVDSDGAGRGRSGYARFWLGAQWMAWRVARQMRQEARR